jgi:hypothetical protein
MRRIFDEPSTGLFVACLGLANTNQDDYSLISIASCFGIYPDLSACIAGIAYCSRERHFGVEPDVDERCGVERNREGNR